MLGQQYNTIQTKLSRSIKSPLTQSGLTDDTTFFNDHVDLFVLPVRSFKAGLLEDSL